MQPFRHEGMPVVSVIIPCYNQGEFLADAIESVLTQTYPHVEVIVVDDGSTDDTARVAARYEERIGYVRKANAGLSAARNTGILHARGEFVHFLDADDFLSPEMLQSQMTVAEMSSADVVHSGWQEVDAQGGMGLRHDAPSLACDPFHILLANNLGPPCCVTVRRAAFANTGLFDVALTSCEDWDMWLRLAAAGVTFAAVPHAYAFYRRHPRSMSTDYEHMWRMTCAVQRKARNCHAACKACSEAMRSSRGSHRNAYFTSLICRDVLARYRNREFGTGTLRLCQAMLRHPALIHFLGVTFVIRLSNRLGKRSAGARASFLP